MVDWTGSLADVFACPDAHLDVTAGCADGTLDVQATSNVASDGG